MSPSMIGHPWRLREAIVVAALMCALGALVVPAVARSREDARKRRCIDNLGAIGVALRQYHHAHLTLPPAAVWDGSAVRTAMLFDVKRIDRITRENWAQLLLQGLGQANLAATFDSRELLMSPANEEARTTQVREFTCPSDRFNSPYNRYGFQPWDDRPPIAELARGNYAINGGTHCFRLIPESTTAPRGEKVEVVVDSERKLFRAVGSGVAGINHSFALDDFVNGQATLVAVDEIRAGVHPLDLRGAWALGHIGASITWSHGVVGDDGGPNNTWSRSDDIMDCQRLHRALGSDRLRQLCMPCVSYVDRSQEATARSSHAGGVNALFVDGAVRFVTDEVDPGLWHVMHSRETPAELLGDLDAALAAAAAPDAAAPSGRLIEPRARGILTNSLGMRFVVVPGGTFTMGLPDVGNAAQVPPECAPHEVTIRRSFWLGTHEVTQKQYQLVMGVNPSHHRGETAGAESTEDFPVENVTWNEAAEFCRRLRDVREEKAEHRRYRLPTEAEWEYACRSGKSQPYHWTARRKPDDKSGEAAGIEPALPVVGVGSYPANEFGLYDMRGNVWEWCGDWFDRDYYSRSSASDPRGPAQGYLKVVRGSDWTFVGEPCHINYPMMPPWKKSAFVGFRLVCEIGEPDGDEVSFEGTGRE